LSNISLSASDFQFLSIDLISVSSDVRLVVVVDSALFVEQESQVIDLLLERQDSDGIRLVLSSELVICQQLSKDI
jgi:hypothetical protein